jgi:hypothetical protein
MKRIIAGLGGLVLMVALSQPAGAMLAPQYYEVGRSQATDVVSGQVIRIVQPGLAEVKVGAVFWGDIPSTRVIQVVYPTAPPGRRPIGPTCYFTLAAGWKSVFFLIPGRAGGAYRLAAHGCGMIPAGATIASIQKRIAILAHWQPPLNAEQAGKMKVIYQRIIRWLKRQ